jgi:hypothetical protein
LYGLTVSASSPISGPYSPIRSYRAGHLGGTPGLRRPLEQLLLVCVPGHAGIPGNEAADEAARLGGLDAQGDTAIDFPSAKAAILEGMRRETRRQFKTAVYPDYHTRRACDGIRLPHDPARSPLEERALRLLRIDRHPACRATLARYGRMDTTTGAAVEADCPVCPGSPHDAAHILLSCTTGADDRRRIFDGLPFNAHLPDQLRRRCALSCARSGSYRNPPYSDFAAEDLQP